MKTILSILMLMCLALPAQTPPATNSGAFPSFPDPPPRRRGTNVNRTAVPNLPAAGTVTQTDPAAATPVTIPTPTTPTPAPGEGVPAGSVATPGVVTPNVAAGSGAPAIAEEIMFPPKAINYTGADLGLILPKYSELINRSVLRSPAAEAPLKNTVFFVNHTPLTRSEAIQAYQAIFAMNGLAFVEVGEKFLRVVPTAEAVQQGQKPIVITRPEELPEMGQFVTYILQLKYVKPTEMGQILQPFQSGKFTGITAVEPQMLILRDFAENIKRMLEMVEKIDVGAPPEFESEVIPIMYAKAEEIAQALGALSGSGGSTATMGTRAAGGGPSGANTRPGMGNYNQNQGLGGIQSPNALGNTGTPSGGASFSDRINRIVNNAARMSATGSGEFQIIGPNKIVADVRSNSLMVFASRDDMRTIKKIIGQLDVVLAQVLIETVILDVNLGDSYNMGVSYLQKKPTESGKFRGVGALNNVGFLNEGSFSGATNAIGSGFSYLGSFGQDLDVTLTAIADDRSVKVIQRPQIMTSHATAGSIFVGSTVPYVSSTYYGGGFGGGPSSSYQQLRVGINLTVTPYINKDGLVVMQIDEAIDELGAPVAIQGVGDVPSTVSRTLSAEIAVHDRQTIVLGGFIRTSGSEGKSGIPILKDIPLLGMLFSNTTRSKDRSELLVLMRPTVLRTPELASTHTREIKKHLPGIRAAEQESAKDEARRVEAADRKLGPVPHENGTNQPAAGRDAQGFLPNPGQP